MPKKILQLYHEAIGRMSISADADIESIRRRIIRSEFNDLEASPETLARIAERDEDWAGQAFDDLRMTRFIITNWAEFVWYRPAASSLDDIMAQLAAMEATAIVRLSSMECAPAMPTIRRLADAFMMQADGEDEIAAVRRQNIWHRSRRKLAECGPRLLLGFRRRAYGVASADVQWSVA